MMTTTEKNPEFDNQLERECPACCEDCGIDEAWESDAKTCAACGASIVAVIDGAVMRFCLDDDDGDAELPDDSPLSLPAIVDDDGQTVVNF